MKTLFIWSEGGKKGKYHLRLLTTEEDNVGHDMMWSEGEGGKEGGRKTRTEFVSNGLSSSEGGGKKTTKILQICFRSIGHRKIKM